MQNQPNRAVRSSSNAPPFFLFFIVNLEDLAAKYPKPSRPVQTWNPHFGRRLPGRAPMLDDPDKRRARIAARKAEAAKTRNEHRMAMRLRKLSLACAEILEIEVGPDLSIISWRGRKDAATLALAKSAAERLMNELLQTTDLSLPVGDVVKKRKKKAKQAKKKAAARSEAAAGQTASGLETADALPDAKSHPAKTQASRRETSQNYGTVVLEACSGHAADEINAVAGEAFTVHALTLPVGCARTDQPTVIRSKARPGRSNGQVIADVSYNGETFKPSDGIATFGVDAVVSGSDTTTVQALSPLDFSGGSLPAEDGGASYELPVLAEIEIPELLLPAGKGLPAKEEGDNSEPVSDGDSTAQDGDADANDASETGSATDDLWAELESLEHEAVHWKAACQEKERALHEAVRAKERAEAALSAAKTDVSAARAAFVATAASLVLNPHATIGILEALRFAAMLFPDRIVVLPSAYESAAKLDGLSKRGNRLVKLLVRLGTSYYEALLEKGDAAARKVFTPDEYASCESDATSRGQLGRMRDFAYGGKKLRMGQHLKLGISADTSCTLRCYFAWLADERKFVIGHCGEHLPVFKHRN